MTQIDPSKVAQVVATLQKKPLVSNACIGCGACVAISGDVFTLNDDGYSIVLDLPSYEGKDVDDSIIACPVSAISWSK
jgi:ferredoxin